MDGKLCVCTAHFGTRGMHTLHGFNEYFDVDEEAAVNLNKVALYFGTNRVNPSASSWRITNLHCDAYGGASFSEYR